ncbi:GIY-YIG nuclease family protein [Litoribacter alkaliphilus]|uniref:GIY-YIG nuclease family protein n=1 Tax=Litoribacter ruber TaxID=702568 RepID=A0AAP2CJW5_9BACT|nr:GIY-YIG nuclease family protein [Litoribacter alkaliphilus]MBS9524561.1 GIY-YIG nuclease family protein [Litoribacter alkaliphilus]
MYTVYVLYSFTSKKLYTGFSSDFITRFHFHNEKSTKGFTKKFRPWYCIHVEFFQLIKEAMSREKT